MPKHLNWTAPYAFIADQDLPRLDEEGDLLALLVWQLRCVENLSYRSTVVQAWRTLGQPVWMVDRHYVSFFGMLFAMTDEFSGHQLAGVELCDWAAARLGMDGAAFHG